MEINSQFPLRLSVVGWFNDEIPPNNCRVSPSRSCPYSADCRLRKQERKAADFPDVRRALLQNAWRKDGPMCRMPRYCLGHVGSQHEILDSRRRWQHRVTYTAPEAHFTSCFQGAVSRSLSERGLLTHSGPDHDLSAISSGLKHGLTFVIVDKTVNIL